MSDPIGEAIQADSQVLLAECHALYGAPAFGSFVRADCIGSGLAHFAVVTRVSTAPLDGTRIVQAHKLAPGELEQRKPHLTAVLRTTFEARIIGYGDASARLAGTPPLPPRLHCFLYPATAEEVRDVTRTPNWLRPLTQLGDTPVEDLLVCAIEKAIEAWGVEAPIVAWGKYLARLLRSDYVTLEGVLQRLSPASSLIPPVSPTVTTGTAHPKWEEPLPLTGNGRAAKRSPAPMPLGDRDPFE